VLVSPEGDASTTLFETTGYIAGITWSPDGSTIAFGTSGDHSMFGAGVQFSDYHLETVSVAGGKTAPLGDITRATSPAWSPDGTTIAFVQDLNHLALMDVADGSSQIVATSTPASGPAWSPDGSWIAFVSEAVDGPTTIALIRPDGSQLRHIYTCQGGCLPLLSWSPDGASIAVTDFTNHSESVELLSPTTGDVRTMDLTGPRPAALDWQPIPADGSTASSAPLTSSGLVADGTLRCTVELPVNPLVPGQPTGASFTVTNVTDGAVQVWLGTNGYAGWLVFSADGLDLQDSGLTHAGIHGPPPDEQALAPGGSIAIGAMDTAVLWSGPLDVTPHCVDAALPAVQMEVMAPGAPASADAAIAQAVSSLSDAFVGCVPATSGAWVTGTFGTSDGTIDARCGAYVVERDGFDVVALVAVSPPDAPELDLAQLPDRIEAVPPPMFPQGSSVRVSWWVLVLTQDSTSCATHYAMSMGPDSYGGGGGICRAT